ncbi:tRNA (adenosine(37)-N6)-threonylcarbamoyltransferase complex dimerization subunit type 1 TsaB [Caballeronia sp. LZ062]|uniref:tRNA (adenosine(37)-N6)-threonylcarbamoyltransferase complex dimerization subunit type 1 TsaB n=1 Tax=unclassified Caballeronia TaxID=2646786 RepID=UPI002855A1DF|nr:MULTISPECIES: tRNA (adenosine(37)-N6)-threonylcarbamoyltransferase complex dimerization subunit type 1 TsaB [unclassified Caballeronia]MDR5854305.1 tRNA (adenosine(37)-N6)-threonylcarbamoyltransferase complex dimerization subunit type 1 TsaB [Caballeronia sp. LZ050]MDR5871164.1 tRNA (adenosine(37)-N6)-threonylcarbamoyltransferase complex dimerization subunit type 1 TsaB [Caballeronia sp. LZ062]
MTRTVLLALDTSTEFCSVALLLDDSAPRPSSAAAPAYASGDTSVWFRHEATGAVSSTRLLPAVRELLGEAGLALADCNAIAFGAGPGSFTGLRTATGVAQGLAFGLNVPVVPVSTLLACAEAARLNDASLPARVLVALDARMDEVYWAEYEHDPALGGDWRELHAASLDAPAALPLPSAPFALAGNAAAAFGDRLPALAAATRVDRDALPHALPVALLGLRALRAGRALAPELAAPDYVRNKVAQTTAERTEARAAAARSGADSASAEALR